MVEEEDKEKKMAYKDREKVAATEEVVEREDKEKKMA